jgi:tetratricopeptide (TPR) repeat protein
MHRILHNGGVMWAALVLMAGSAAAQELKFNDYRSAMSAAAGLYNSGNLAASRPAFEAAVEMARNDSEKKRALEPLVKVYAESGEYDRMFETAEQVVALETHKASVSMAVRKLLENCQRKNQLDAFKKRYEDQAAKEPDERLPLHMLSGYHSTVTRDFGKQAEYIEKLVALDTKEKQPADAELMADLAFAYRLAGENEKSATLYEATAELSKDLQSWCHMEAAVAWQQAGNMDKALAAANKAHEAGPDAKAKQSLYRWHRSLGDVFLAGKQKEQAIKQLTAAQETAAIDAYKQQCAEAITKAQAL